MSNEGYGFISQSSEDKSNINIVRDLEEEMESFSTTLVYTSMMREGEVSGKTSQPPSAYKMEEFEELYLHQLAAQNVPRLLWDKLCGKIKEQKFDVNNILQFVQDERRDIGSQIYCELTTEVTKYSDIYLIDNMWSFESLAAAKHQLIPSPQLQLRLLTMLEMNENISTNNNTIDMIIQHLSYFMGRYTTTIDHEDMNRNEFDDKENNLEDKEILYIMDEVGYRLTPVIDYSDFYNILGTSTEIISMNTDGISRSRSSSSGDAPKSSSNNWDSRLPLFRAALLLDMDHPTVSYTMIWPQRVGLPGEECTVSHFPHTAAKRLSLRWSLYRQPLLARSHEMNDRDCDPEEGDEEEEEEEEEGGEEDTVVIIDNSEYDYENDGIILTIATTSSSLSSHQVIHSLAQLGEILRDYGYSTRNIVKGFGLTGGGVENCLPVWEMSAPRYRDLLNKELLKRSQAASTTTSTSVSLALATLLQLFLLGLPVPLTSLLPSSKSIGVGVVSNGNGNGTTNPSRCSHIIGLLDILDQELIHQLVAIGLLIPVTKNVESDSLTVDGGNSQRHEAYSTSSSGSPHTPTNIVYMQSLLQLTPVGGTRRLRKPISSSQTKDADLPGATSPPALTSATTTTTTTTTAASMMSSMTVDDDYEELILITDFAQTLESPGIDPVMYIGPDTLGLVAAVNTLHNARISSSLLKNNNNDIDNNSISATICWPSVLDICSGCGVQGLSMIWQGFSQHAVLVEKNERAARFARCNGYLNNISQSITIVHTQVEHLTKNLVIESILRDRNINTYLHSNIPRDDMKASSMTTITTTSSNMSSSKGSENTCQEGIKDEWWNHKFDFVVANPPYIPCPAAGSGAPRTSMTTSIITKNQEEKTVADSSSDSSSSGGSSSSSMQLPGYGDGGSNGEDVTEIIINKMSDFLSSKKGSLLCLISNMVNVYDYPSKLNSWWNGSNSSLNSQNQPLDNRYFNAYVTHGELWNPLRYAELVLRDASRESQLQYANALSQNNNSVINIDSDNLHKNITICDSDASNICINNNSSIYTSSNNNNASNDNRNHQPLDTIANITNGIMLFAVKKYGIDSPDIKRNICTIETNHDQLWQVLALGGAAGVDAKKLLVRGFLGVISSS